MKPGKPSQALTKADQAELATRVALTPAIEQKLLVCIADGVFARQACDFAGIDFAVYREWKKWAVDGVEPYTSFFRKVLDVEQERVRDAMGAIKHGDKEWKAQSWWLERRYPYWREDNTTDEPPPAPPLVTIIREIRARYGQEEIRQIVDQLMNSDPVMSLPPAGGADAADEHREAEFEGGGGEVDVEPDFAVATDAAG